MSRETDPRCHLLSPDHVLLPTIHEAERLGVHAMAQVRLYAPDSPFVAYLAGFDGADAFWGLMCAHEMVLGRLYASGLTVAWTVWVISIQRDPQFKPASLQHLMQDKRVEVKPRLSAMTRSCHPSRAMIRARLCLHLAKEPHHLYCNL